MGCLKLRHKEENPNHLRVIWKKNESPKNRVNFYAFGSLQPGRSYNSPDYRFGFNGQEKTDEISGSGNHYTAEFWEYDPRAVHRWNIDPAFRDNPGWSPYVINFDNPIWFRDPKGDQPTNEDEEQESTTLAQGNETTASTSETGTNISENLPSSTTTQTGDISTKLAAKSKQLKQQGFEKSAAGIFAVLTVVKPGTSVSGTQLQKALSARFKSANPATTKELARISSISRSGNTFTVRTKGGARLAFGNKESGFILLKDKAKLTVKVTSNKIILTSLSNITASMSQNPGRFTPEPKVLSGSLTKTGFAAFKTSSAFKPKIEMKLGEIFD